MTLSGQAEDTEPSQTASIAEAISSFECVPPELKFAVDLSNESVQEVRDESESNDLRKELHPELISAGMREAPSDAFGAAALELEDALGADECH
jgi:hypothetical protein